MQGSQCNQAIMLVTDGAPSGYREIFEKYNWPHKPVRVFSYVIGREIIDTAATNWMACANKGSSNDKNIGSLEIAVTFTRCMMFDIDILLDQATLHESRLWLKSASRSSNIYPSCLAPW